MGAVFLESGPSHVNRWLPSKWHLWDCIKLGVNQTNMVVYLQAMGKIVEDSSTCSARVSCSCYMICCRLNSCFLQPVCCFSPGSKGVEIHQTKCNWILNYVTNQLKFKSEFRFSCSICPFFFLRFLFLFLCPFAFSICLLFHVLRFSPSRSSGLDVEGFQPRSKIESGRHHLFLFHDLKRNVLLQLKLVERMARCEVC